MNELKAVLIEDFQQYFQDQKLHFCPYVASQGSYFDGEKVNL